MGVVSMVARRSPKPKVRVRILPPVPTQDVNTEYETV